MILADTSIWIDHLRRPNPLLNERLGSGSIVTHPFVVGELACGNLPDRNVTLRRFDRLPRVVIASPHDVREALERRRLHGRGIGYVDIHLLTSTLLSPPATLWTRDKRLHAAAVELGIACAESTFH